MRVLNRVWMGGPPYDDGGSLRCLRNSHEPRLPKPRRDEDPDAEHQPAVPET